MKKILPFLILLGSYLNIIGQTYQHEEIKIRYSDGFAVFNICKDNPKVNFDDKKKYFWYTEFSKIKSTKGGSGGNLLDGKFKFYDSSGNLRYERNYSLGLEDGNFIEWDSLGDIIGKNIYNKGDIVYMKFLNKNNYYIEYNNGKIIFQEGCEKRAYTKNGVLTSEQIWLTDLKSHVKIFYEYNPNQIKEEFYSYGSKNLNGKYLSYYKNGKVEVEGQYLDNIYATIKVGTWKWYNEDGTINSEYNYKPVIIYWPNKEIMKVGGYILDKENDTWLKTGEWKWFKENGNLKERKNYEWGEEVIK